MNNKIIVVLPAYNAEKTLVKTVNDIDKKLVFKIILVDDGSNDQTAAVAKKLKLTYFRHHRNAGYGANQKTCYWEALKFDPDIVVMIHPDYQYPPKYLKYLVAPIVDGTADLMLGTRIRSRAETLKNGMPLYKYIANRFLTLAENVILDLNLSEYHTGFRAFNKKVLTGLNLPKFSNDFIFDQQILIAAHTQNFRIGEVFTPCLYTKESSSINFRRSVIYGLEIIYNLFLYTVNKNWFRN